jgi:ribonuclease P protein component
VNTRDQKLKKKFNAWFQPSDRVVRAAKTFTSIVEISKTKRVWPDVIVSVPRTAGKAVQRNRLRRVIKEQLKPDEHRSVPTNQNDGTQYSSPRKALWIRIKPQIKLPRVIVAKDWLPEVRASLKSLQQKS